MRSLVKRGTKIQTNHGEMPIEEYEYHDKIKIVGTNEYISSSKIYGDMVTGNIHQIIVGSNCLTCSPDSLLMHKDKGWTKASELALEDEVMMEDGKCYPIERINLMLGATRAMYGLDVPFNHYYIANGFVFHDINT